MTKNSNRKKDYKLNLHEILESFFNICSELQGDFCFEIEQKLQSLKLF